MVNWRKRVLTIEKRSPTEKTSPAGEKIDVSEELFVPTDFWDGGEGIEGKIAVIR